MVFLGLIIAGFFHISLHPISNVPHELPSFSTISIRNIPNQNHTSYQSRLITLLIVLIKEPKKLFIPGVRQQLR